MPITTQKDGSGVKTHSMSPPQGREVGRGETGTRRVTRSQVASEQRGDDQPGSSNAIQVLESGAVEEVPGMYELIFYMKHFRPSDIIVKVVDHYIIIDAHHKQHVDELGLVTRSMYRKHALPDSVQVKDLTCLFTCNGFLFIREASETADQVC
ncbi:hypothetical protein NPIL_692571 [Nephila pilipes]|uniref:SHSP domain-containing protein n=1 Tax=Nephila pilipes TaxID=299642 RepID=A0A8X6T2X4_NEPPI|nr:hypothetical protein NPIL_692571 [Nephila pilipes]